MGLLVWFHLADGRMHLDRAALDAPLPFERLLLALRPALALLGDPYRPEDARAPGERLVRIGSLTRWAKRDVGSAADGERDGVRDEAGAEAAALPAVPLPNRLELVVPLLGVDNRARLEALAGADRRVHLGYAVPKGSAPRERRAVEAVRLLRDDGAPFVDVVDLYERHAATFGPPGCTLGTYARTLAAFPHLAVEGLTHRWAALDADPAGAAPTPDPTNPAGAGRRVAPPVEPEVKAASCAGRGGASAAGEEFPLRKSKITLQCVSLA